MTTALLTFHPSFQSTKNIFAKSVYHTHFLDPVYSNLINLSVVGKIILIEFSISTQFPEN